MSEKLPETSSGEQIAELKKSLFWALSKIQFPLVPNHKDDEHAWKGCPGCHEIWLPQMLHEPTCPYIVARAALAAPSHVESGEPATGAKEGCK